MDQNVIFLGDSRVMPCLSAGVLLLGNINQFQDKNLWARLFHSLPVGGWVDARRIRLDMILDPYQDKILWEDWKNFI